MTEESAPVETSHGRVSAEFATNGWVLLTCGDRSGQFQVFKKSQLAATLRSEFAFGDDEAEESAGAIWRQRPRASSMRATTPSVFLSTGLPAWTVLPLVFLAIVAIGVFFAVAPRFIP